jgi:deoxyribose-phosphate aldolase
LIDHTLLKADATPEDIEVLCNEAVRYGFAAVCVNPWLVRHAAEALAGTRTEVCSVAGFPLGAGTAWAKSTEAQGAIADGATEVDLVINIGALKSGETQTLDEELSLVRRSIGDAIFKVILEVPLLSDVEVDEGCRIAIGCGADFLKTCTGFGPRGVEVNDVIRMRRVAGPAVGVKAAGGIKTLVFARELVAAGATRLGSSSSVAIADEESREGASG